MCRSPGDINTKKRKLIKEQKENQGGYVLWQTIMRCGENWE